MKKRVALITGGYSGEYPVSLKSAANVKKGISEKYDVYLIEITVNGWHYMDNMGRIYDVDKNDFSLNLNGSKINFDCAFICIHGTPGEDGMLQGYLEMLKIPYTSCDSFTSALTMNKSFTNSVINSIGVNVAKSIMVSKTDDININDIASKMTLPLFVKPNSGGSSIGTSKVKVIDELESAIKKAFNEDSQVIIEEFIDGREFSCGVVYRKGEIVVLPVTEVKTTREFFDFEAKYTPGMAEEITPADIPADILAEVHKQLIKVYKKLNCRGIIRIDFFLQQPSNKFFFLEINTIPGQTATSFIPQQVAAKGWDISEFYCELIETALSR